MGYHRFSNILSSKRRMYFHSFRKRRREGEKEKGEKKKRKAAWVLEGALCFASSHCPEGALRGGEGGGKKGKRGRKGWRMVSVGLWVVFKRSTADFME